MVVGAAMEPMTLIGTIVPATAHVVTQMTLPGMAPMNGPMVMSVNHVHDIDCLDFYTYVTADGHIGWMGVCEINGEEFYFNVIE